MTQDLLRLYEFLGRISSGKWIIHVIRSLAEILREIFDKIGSLQIKKIFSDVGISLQGHPKLYILLRAEVGKYSVTVMVNYARKYIYTSVIENGKARLAIDFWENCRKLFIDYKSIKVSQIRPKKSDFERNIVKFEKDFFVDFYQKIREVLRHIINILGSK